MWRQNSYTNLNQHDESLLRNIKQLYHVLIVPVLLKDILYKVLLMLTVAFHMLKRTSTIVFVYL